MGTLALKTFAVGMVVHGSIDTPVERRQERQAQGQARYFVVSEGIGRADAPRLDSEEGLARLIKKEAPPQ